MKESHKVTRPLAGVKVVNERKERLPKTKSKNNIFNWKEGRIPPRGLPRGFLCLIFMTLFDCLKDIITNKTGTLHTQDGFKKAWNNYMIIRYLSMDRRFKDLAVEMNRYSATLTAEQMYLFLVKMVPYSKRNFIKYIKPSKTKKK